MLKNQIEKSQIGLWSYERYSFHSEVLGQDFHCGIFRQGPAGQITRTFYLLHGGSADDTQAVQAGLLPVLADLLKDQPGTQIVLPYVGNSFLHDHPTTKNKSFSHYFLQELVPACERGTQTRSESRFIGGWSMGGHAALNMFMRHAAEFKGVGTHFPTLVDFNYNDPQQAEAYAVRLNVADNMMAILVGEFQKEFIDLKDFNSHNPLALAREKASSDWSQKRIYFDVGQSDEFGLQEGGGALHQILQQKKVTHQFESVPQGKHDGPFLHAQVGKMIKYLLL